MFTKAKEKDKVLKEQFLVKQDDPESDQKNHKEDIIMEEENLSDSDGHRDQSKENIQNEFNQENNGSDEETDTFQRYENEIKQGNFQEKRANQNSSVNRIGRFYKDPNSSQYTVPEPFDFLHRDKNRSKSIRERKFEEMIKQKQEEEEEISKYQFRAKSVPPVVAEKL